jgi:murein DD-endopeptidase MepM/ murein hydrolase activator NlpD
MSVRRTRAIAYGVVALLGVAAVLFTKPLPPAARTPAGEVLTVAHTEHMWRERRDTIGRGESLINVLARGGVSEIVAREAIRAAKTLDPRRIPIGMPVLVRSAPDDSIPSEIVLQLAVDRLLHIRRSDSGWTGDEEQLPWRTDTIVVSGTIRSNLYEAMDVAARDALPVEARRQLTWTLADIFEYRVDMSRDLQVNDAFHVLVARSIGPQGTTRIGTVFAATMQLSGTTLEALRFTSTKVAGTYFDAKGKSLRAGFLRAPLQFRRISSGFGMRKHPILGVWKKHAGTDYAASSGTPVRAIGDGVVIRAGWSTGYGNVIDIRHANGYVSRYGHLRSFAKGVRGGTRVVSGSTVGYVGMTGLATAPHLHFEVLVGGVQRNPRLALQNASSDPIPAVEMATFTQLRARLLAILESPTQLAVSQAGLVQPTH